MKSNDSETKSKQYVKVVKDLWLLYFDINGYLVNLQMFYILPDMSFSVFLANVTVSDVSLLAF